MHLFVFGFFPLATWAQGTSPVQANLFFSQDLYVAGDTAFFRVVLPSSTSPLKGVHLLHVDLIDHEGKIVYRQHFKIKGGSGGNQWIVPALPEPGAYVFSVRLNGESQPSVNKTIVIAGKKNSMVTTPFSPAVLLHRTRGVEFQGVGGEYYPRQKVDVKINTHESPGASVKSMVAVRVINTRVVQPDSAMKSVPVNDALQQGSRGSANPNSLFSSALEWQGKVLYKGTSIPVPDSTHVAIFLQRNKIGYDFYTNGGRFKVICTSDFFESDKVFVLAFYRGRELTVDWVPDQDESSPIHAPVVPVTANSDWYAEFSASKREVDRAFYFFGNGAIAAQGKDKREDLLEDEFASPDIIVQLKDYLIFPTIEEIINEVIPALALKRKGDSLILKMNLLISLDNPVASKETPLLIIDGVMTKDLNAFLNLKPADVLSVKLIRKMNKLLPWGLLGKDGIVFVTTKNAGVAQHLMADYPDVKGLTEPLPYFPKNYSLPRNPLFPDFRTLLYWNPELPVDKSGQASFSFYTSDSLGDFVIQVDGETYDTRFSGDHQFKVSFKPRE